MKTDKRVMSVLIGLLVACVSVATIAAQSPTRPPTPGGTTGGKAPAPTAPPPATAAASDYIIGIDDLLGIGVWREKDLNVEVVVRPDGKVSFPLIDEIAAAGLTPNQLKANITAALTAKNFFDEPIVSVVVKQINSRKVFIQGSVGKPGPYPMNGPMTLLQLITLAGGLQEFADKEHIIIISGTLKRPDGEWMSWIVNFSQITDRRNLAKNNPELKPGDQVIVK